MEAAFSFKSEPLGAKRCKERREAKCPRLSGKRRQGIGCGGVGAGIRRGEEGRGWEPSWRRRDGERLEGCRGRLVVAVLGWGRKTWLGGGKSRRCLGETPGLEGEAGRGGVEGCGAGSARGGWAGGRAGGGRWAGRGGERAREMQRLQRPPRQ